MQKQPHLSPHHSSQVYRPTLQPILATPSHMALWRGTPALLPSHCWPTLSTLSDDVMHLQEEINNAMVHLLSAKAAIDRH